MVVLDASAASGDVSLNEMWVTVNSALEWLTITRTTDPVTTVSLFLTHEQDNFRITQVDWGLSLMQAMPLSIDHWEVLIATTYTTY